MDRKKVIKKIEDAFDYYESKIQKLKAEVREKDEKIEQLEEEAESQAEEISSLENGNIIELPHQMHDNIVTMSTIKNLIDNLDYIPITELDNLINKYKKL